jgi:DNA invertase Pin-like site-specific DNA recombinase
MNVFSYIRVSGRGQIDGDGPERQRQSIEKFSKAHALYCRGEFYDRAVSGTITGMDRPQFSELLAYVDNRADSPEDRIGAIVVERMDRLARDLMVSEVLLAECRKRNLKVFSADQEALIDMASDGGDPMRIAVRQIMAVLSQLEKSMIVAKLKAARDRIKASGRRCEGKKPYGHYLVEKPVLQAMKDLYDPAIGYQALANLLNQAGYKTRRGNPWSRSMVFDILKRNGIK